MQNSPSLQESDLIAEPHRNAGVRVEVVRTLADFEALATEWEALVQNAGEFNLNLEHGWLVTWLKWFPPSRIFVILLRDSQGQLVGAAPLKINRTPYGFTRRFLRHVQFIGTEPCVNDRMKILCHPALEQEAVIKSVADQLLKEQSLWDVIDLRYCEDARQLDYLNHCLSAYTFEARLHSPTAIPYIRLPETVEAYRANGMRKELKRKLRSSYNHMKTDFGDMEPEMEFQSAGSPASEKHMEAFFKKHIAYWQSRGYRSDLKRFPKLKQFYQSICQLYQSLDDAPARFQFSVMKLAGNPISYHFGLWQGDGYLAHISAYDSLYGRYRPGYLHMDALVQHAVRLGGVRFEFGRGDEAYKYQWTDAKMPLWDLVILKNRWAHLQWLWNEQLLNIYLIIKRAIRVKR